MFKNYLLIAYRNLLKHKSFSIINIGGLAIGMAICLLILQYVSFKLSFDQFNDHAKDLYRVVNDRYQNGKLIQHGTITYSGISKAMQHDFPEVENYSRVRPNGPCIVIDKVQDKKLGDQNGFLVDPSFMKMFDYKLVAGDPVTALNEPRSILLTTSLAKKLFGISNHEETLIGKSVTIDQDQRPFKITGILEDSPVNSHLKFDFLESYNTLYSGENSWQDADYNFTSSDFWHYILLKPGTDYKSVDAKMKAFSERYFQGNKISGSDEKFYLQPLSNAHLYSDFEYEIGQTGSATVVWSLLIIALFIIIIAWVNYINLSTARAVERAGEVGIRKTIGGARSQLIIQFLTESIVVNLLSILIAIGIVFLFQHRFNQLLQSQLSLSYLFTKGLHGYTIPVALVLTFLSGIVLSGFYPAFVLSSFNPIEVLKGKLAHSKHGITFRKALVIGQFSITVALIIGSMVVVNQLKFINEKELGFNMDQVLVINPPVLTGWDSTYIGKMNSFKEELKKLSQVKNAATSWNVPGGDIGRSFDISIAESTDHNKYTMRHTGVDYDFMNVYDIKIIAGRNFTPSDHNPDFSKLNSIIVNSLAVKTFGYADPSEILGKTLLRGKKKWTVIGVVDNYHQKSLRYALEPMIFMPAYSTYSEISVKLNPGDVTNTIALIKGKYESFFPGNIFDYIFQDEQFNRQYQNDKLFGRVFSIFAGFAIFVACIGLLGLAMFSTIQRTKEIGIRKVLGASVTGLFVLVSKDFLKLVLIAAVIAFPLAWFVMNKWLNDFAFRIEISLWIFIAAGLAALGIAIATVGYQAIKAALANPISSLRSE